MAKNTITNGSPMTCTQGSAPANLVVTPNGVSIDGKAPGTVDDHQGLVNIPPLGLCKSMTNPIVQLASMAAGNVLTPQPCIPITGKPWAPGQTTVVLSGAKATLKQLLTTASKCKCEYDGEISIQTVTPDVLFGPRATPLSPAPERKSVPPAPSSKPGLLEKIRTHVGPAAGGTAQEPSGADERRQQESDAQRDADKSRPKDTTKGFPGVPVTLPRS